MVWTRAILGLHLLALGAVPFEARATISTTCASQAVCTLAELQGGATITIDGLEFRHWETVTSEFFDELDFDPTAIELVPLDDDPAHPGLRWVGNGEWQATLTEVQILSATFAYTVARTGAGGPIQGQSVEALSGAESGDANNDLNIVLGLCQPGDPSCDDFSDPMAMGLSLVEASTPPNMSGSAFDFQTFAPQTEVRVLAGLELEGGAGSASIEEFETRVFVPEPAPLLALPAFALAAALRRRGVVVAPFSSPDA